MVVWGGDVRDQDPWSGKNTTLSSITKILTPIQSGGETASNDLSFRGLCRSSTS